MKCEIASPNHRCVIVPNSYKYFNISKYKNLLELKISSTFFGIHQAVKWRKNGKRELAKKNNNI